MPAVTHPNTIEQRRRVWEMRYLQRMSEAAIAAEEGVSQQRISQLLRQHDTDLEKKFGKDFKPDGYVRTIIERMETRRGWMDREYVRALPGKKKVRDAKTGETRTINIDDTPMRAQIRRRAAQTANMIDREILNVMHDVGIIERQIGRVVVTPAEIMKALRESDDVDVTEGELISAGERALLPESFESGA